MKTLISFVVLSALMSCGPAPELKRRTFFTTTDKATDGSALGTKTDEEIIKIKYNESVPLRCEIKIMDGSNLDLTKFNGGVTTLNAAKKELQWEPLKFKLNGDRDISITIMIDSLVIDRAVKTPVVDGTVYEMSYSPSALITVKMTESVNGKIVGLETVQKQVIEQVSEEVKGFDLGTAVSQEFRCSLATTINERYSKQWKVKGRKEINLPATEVAPAIEVAPSNEDAPASEAPQATEVAPVTEVVPATEAAPETVVPATDPSPVQVSPVTP